MKPNPAQYNPDPHYLRRLLVQARLSQEKAAALIRLSPRQLRYYLSTASDHQDAPYTVQFALEALAAAAECDEPEQRQNVYLAGGFSIAENGAVWLSRNDVRAILGAAPLGTSNELRTVVAWLIRNGGPAWLRKGTPAWDVRESDGAWCLQVLEAGATP